MPYSKTTDISQLIDLNSDDTIEEKESQSREKVMRSAGNKIRSGGLKETYMYNLDKNNNDFHFETYEPPRNSIPQPPQRPQRSSYSENFENKVIEPMRMNYMEMDGGNMGRQRLSCIDVCNHVNSCPVCSRFYNNDKTVYIIIIVLLSIITLICFKKILNI